MNQFLEQAKQVLPDLTILTEEPMKLHTSFRIGGVADYFCTPSAEELRILQKLAEKMELPLTVIGNGSNLLVSDKGIRGIVVEVSKGMSDLSVKGTRIIAGAGVLLSKIANAALMNSLTGMEFAAGIPGSVGGAVVMNAGAYGGEMKEIVESVKVLTPEGEFLTLSVEELDLSYRHSIIPERGYVITEVTLKLLPGDKESIRSRMEELRVMRTEKQPLNYPSAGSTFKRPTGYFAGKLIMDADLRGYTVGGAQVSEKHCGFVINKGDATCQDVLQLMQEVRDKVEAEFNVTLEPEVRIIGDFS